MAGMKHRMTTQNRQKWNAKKNMQTETYESGSLPVVALDIVEDDDEVLAVTVLEDVSGVTVLEDVSGVTVVVMVVGDTIGESVVATGN